MTRQRNITDLGIKAIKPRATRFEQPIGGGLFVQVQPSGRKGYAVRFRVNGRTKKLTLQSGITLAAARREAADALYQVEQGIDPTVAKRKRKQEARIAADETFAAVAANYFRRDGAKLRSGPRQQRDLERLAFKTLGERPIGEIRRSEIIRLLDEIEERNGTKAADLTLAYIRKIMNWHAARSDEFRSPIVRGMTRGKTQERERILSDDELRAVWTAAESNLPDPYAAVIMFLLLTSARRSEATDLVHAEIVGDVWTLPAARNKVKVELQRPLSKAALDLLAKLPRVASCDFAFTNDGRRPLNGGMSRRKLVFDRQCGVRDWTLHDLRRTARSLLSRAGVNADIAERCLGHMIPGVRGVYDRHRYVQEQRLAFEALAALIKRIVHQPADNVIALPARG
jgi:integrase